MAATPARCRWRSPGARGAGAQRRSPRSCAATAGRPRCSTATPCGRRWLRRPIRGRVWQRGGAWRSPTREALALGLRRVALTSSGCACTERTPVEEHDGRRCPAHPGRPGPRRPGPAGGRRVPAARGRHPAARGAGLRLRDRHRAADRRASGARSAGRAGRGSRTAGDQLPLLPADPRRPHPVRRLRGRLPVRQPRRRRAPEPPPPRPPTGCSRSTCWRQFPALEGSAVTHAWGGPIDTC